MTPGEPRVLRAVPSSLLQNPPSAQTGLLSAVPRSGDFHGPRMASPDPADAPPAVRRPWISPCLTRHESLAVLTRQEYPYEGGPVNPFDGSANAVPCSQGFCPP